MNHTSATNCTSTRKAVVLAAGLGTRMRRDSHSVADPDKRQAASVGLKAMVPLRGRPFMDYVLQSLFDAGFERVCLVIRPGRSALVERYERLNDKLAESSVTFAVQTSPRGTADAVLAAEEFADGENFVVVNGDNLYPADALTALRAAPAPALAAFTREGLAEGNFPPERIAAFAVLDLDEDLRLRRIVEKPRHAEALAHDGRVLVSMNCWHFTPAIFEAARSIQPDPGRLEYELPTAVQHAIDRMGLTFRAVTCDQPVLDLTDVGDIAAMERRLAEVRVDLPEIGA